MVVADLAGAAVSAMLVALGICGLVQPQRLPLWGSGTGAMMKSILFVVIGGLLLITSLVDALF